MNDMLKGFRTLIVTFSAMLLGSVDVINASVIQIMDIVGAQLSEGGAVAALMAAAISVKQVVTDTIPKLQGNLNK